MKHGPIALIDENTPSVFLIPHGVVYDKVIANMEEIKARGGPVIAVAVRGGTQVGRPGRRCDRDPDRRRFPAADRHGDPAATAGLPHRGLARLRRRQAAQPGQERDGGVADAQPGILSDRPNGYETFYRVKKNRERPIIGDRGSPSKLGEIQPDNWLAEYTTELLNVLHVLALLVEWEPAQSQLLEAICEGATLDFRR